MLRHFFSLLFIALFALPTTTRAIEFDPLTDKEVLRQAIYDGDIRFVESALEKSQDHFRAGDITGDDMRVLYQIFTTTNPKVIKFVERWLRGKPNSPYANTAQAWIYFTAGWIIRGDGWAREIYPEALIRFRELHDKSWDHAERAYEVEPRLIPATDAMIRLSNSTGQERRAYKALYAVMTTDPNMGTLRRALEMTMPGWGGSWQQAERICDHYGPMVEWKEIDPVLYCMLYAGGEYHRGEKNDWVVETLKSEKIPSLDYMRLRRATTGLATRAEAEFAYNYLNRDEVTSVEHARSFDFEVAPKYGYDFISEPHQRRARDYARAAIEHDPYDPELIEILQRGIARYSYNERGTVRIKSIERPSREEEIEYARRLLLVAPYNPDHWQKFASVKYLARDPDDFLKNEPHLINTMVYSNHDPAKVHGYIFAKWRQLDNLERLDTDPQSKEWQKLNDDQRAKLEKVRQEWLTKRADVNMDKDIRCPMMRAYRLFERICETAKHYACDIDPMQREMYELVRDNVTKRRVCTGEMSAPPEELFYTPIPVDLGEPGG